MLRGGHGARRRGTAAARPSTRPAGGQSCGALLAHRGRIAGALGRHSRPTVPSLVGRLGRRCRSTTVTASVTRVCRRACTARVVPRDRSCCVDVSPQARAFRAPWCAAMACIGAIPRHDVCLVGPPRSDRGGRRRAIMVVLHSPRVCMICSIDWLVLNARARSVLRRLARSWRRGAHGGRTTPAPPTAPVRGIGGARDHLCVSLYLHAGCDTHTRPTV